MHRSLSTYPVQLSAERLPTYGEPMQRHTRFGHMHRLKWRRYSKATQALTFWSLNNRRHLGNNGHTVESVARFSIGEEGYFFVEELASGRSVTAGMYQGKYNIIFDPYSRQELAVRFSVDPRRDFDHRFIPLPPKKNRVSTDDFEQTIEEAVDNGWDGQPIPGVSLEKLERINKKQP